MIPVSQHAQHQSPGTADINNVRIYTCAFRFNAQVFLITPVR